MLLLLHLVHQLEILVLLVWYHMDMDPVDILMLQIFGHHLPQSRGKFLILFHLRLNLLCSKHDPTMGQRVDVTGTEHNSIPTRQYFQPELLDQQCPARNPLAVIHLESPPFPRGVGAPVPSAGPTLLTGMAHLLQVSCEYGRQYGGL